MNNLFRSLAGACALAVMFGTTACQSTKHEMSETEMMAKVTEYAKPSAGHEALKYKEGHWTLDVKCFDESGKPVMESKAKSDVNWIMENRFLEDNTVNTTGQPFAGHGVTGYDNMSKHYTSVWFDTMSTGIMASEGTYDSKTKTFEYAIKKPDFATGEYSDARMVEIVKDNDHWTMQMWGSEDGGKEYKYMEIQYTRAK